MRSRRRVSAVAHDHHAGMLGKAHSTPPPWCSDTQVAPEAVFSKRVQQGPVGDGIRAIFHGFGLAVGRGHGAGVEVIAPDDHRRLQLAALHHLVEREAETVPVTEAHPADARRQAWNWMRCRAMSSQWCSCVSSGRISFTFASVL